MRPEFVPFHCPVHGHIMSATKESRVECWCGREAAPEGKTLREHLAGLKTRAA